MRVFLRMTLQLLNQKVSDIAEDLRMLTLRFQIFLHFRPQRAPPFCRILRNERGNKIAVVALKSESLEVRGLYFSTGKVY